MCVVLVCASTSCASPPPPPPVTMTPSWFTASAFTIARCGCSVLCRNSPAGSANFLMLSALALRAREREGRCEASRVVLKCCAWAHS